MRTATPARPKVPGLATSRAAVMVLIILLGIGLQNGPVLLLSVPLAWILGPAWARYWGPALANIALEAESRLMFQTLAISFTYGMLAVAAIRSDRQWMLVVSSIFAMAYYVWRKPAVAAFILLLVTAELAPELILFAAPLSVMLAMRDIRTRLGLGPSSPRTAQTLAFAVLALAFTLPFASLVRGERSGLGLGFLQPGGRFQVTTDESDLLGVLVDRARGGSPHVAGSGIAGRAVIGAIGLLLMLAAAVVIWRWFQLQAARAASPSAPALARLERLGARLGRPRRRHEGPLTYGGALVAHTTDPRFDVAAEPISSTVYSRASSDADLAERWLVALENEPGPLPAGAATRVTSWASYIPITVRGLQSCAFVAGVLAVLWVLLQLL